MYSQERHQNEDASTNATSTASVVSMHPVELTNNEDKPAIPSNHELLEDSLSTMTSTNTSMEQSQQQLQLSDLGCPSVQWIPSTNSPGSASSKKSSVKPTSSKAVQLMLPSLVPVSTTRNTISVTTGRQGVVAPYTTMPDLISSPEIPSLGVASESTARHLMVSAELASTCNEEQEAITSKMAQEIADLKAQLDLHQQHTSVAEAIPTHKHVGASPPVPPTNAPVPPPTPAPVTSPPTSFSKRSYLLDTIGSSVLLESSKYTTVDDYDDYVTSNPNSPQALALKWLYEVDEYSWSPSIISKAELVERYALAVLYYATQEEGWVTSSSYYLDAMTSICDWNADASEDQGVYCDTSGSAGRAYQISLSQCHLVGKLPIELTLLTSLRTFFVDENYLYGTVPTFFGSMPSLAFLRMVSNYFTGHLPTELGNLSSLQTFFAYKNTQLTGNIPSQWGGMRSLVWLDLHGNGHTGTIPSNIGFMTRLSHLLIYENNFEGTIPTQMARLRMLLDFKIHDNPSLTGTVPTEFANLSNNFGEFTLYNTAITGSLDSLFCDSWGRSISVAADCLTEIECSCCSACY